MTSSFGQKTFWTSVNITNVIPLIIYTIITGTILSLILKLIIRRQRFSVLEKMPGPKTTFLFGNALDIMGGPTEIFKNFAYKYCSYPGGLSRVWIMHKPFVFIYGASGVEALLNNSKNLDKSTDYTLLHSWLGLGLLTSSGSKWFARRKMLTPAFHFKILDEFIEVFNRQSQKFVEKLEEHSNGKPFNIFPFITLVTLDIILETAMGISVNAQDNPQSEYVKAVHEMGRIVFSRLARPWLQYDAIFYMTEMGRREKRCLKVLHKFSLDVIRERRNEYKHKKKNSKNDKEREDELIGAKKRQAFLDLLIEQAEQNDDLTETDIREEVDTFMFEGHDTTAAGICWTIYLLGQHQDIQEKAYEELESLFGKTERAATSSDIRAMNYLECCIKESLRILPSVPLFIRQLTQDLKINGYMVPRGTDAAIFTYILHRDPQHFPDPLKFQPERFLSENSAKRNPFAYVPFSAGPRNCIGQRFAIMEEKVILSSFLRKYRVESTTSVDDLRLTVDMILRPEAEMVVKIFPRY